MWRLAYLLTLALPLGLIFNRGLMEGCVAGIGLLFLAESFRNKNWSWMADPINKLTLVCWGWLLFVSFFAHSPMQSLGMAASWVRYALLFFALRYWVLADKDAIYGLGKMLAAMMIFVAVDTLWQWKTGVSFTGHPQNPNGRLSGPLDSVKVGIFLAKFLMPSIGIWAVLAAQEKSIKKTALSAFLFAIALLTIMLSGERTAFCSSLIATFSVGILFIVSDRKLRLPVFSIFATATFVAEYVLRTKDWARYKVMDFYMVLSDFGNSDYWNLARAGLLMGREHWAVGAGLKGYRELCKSFMRPDMVDFCNLHPHNPYVEWFAEAGSVGLLLLVALVLAMLWKCLKTFFVSSGRNRIIAAVGIACIIVNFFPFMPTQSTFSNWPAILMWYSLAVAFALFNLVKTKES